MSKQPSPCGSQYQPRYLRPSTARHHQRRCTPGTPGKVKDYFQKIGLRHPFTDEDDYEECLLERFGRAAAEFLNAAHATRQHDETTCALMAANLELGIAVRSQMYGNRYEAFLSWLTTANLPRPRRVLDVGCDIGVQTCFFALLFPEATITGIDSCPEAIACAKQLAEKLQLKNVEFRQADMLDLPEDMKSQRFDLVFSTFMATYAADPEGDLRPARCVEEAVMWKPDPGKAYYARVLADLLTDEGVLVSFERSIFANHFARWLRVLRDAGIGAPAENIEFLEFYDTAFQFDAELPVLVGSKRAGNQASAEDIRRLWMPGPRPRIDRDDYKGLAAESVFVATEPKSFVRGFRRQHHGSELDVYTELWASGPKFLIYDYCYGGRSLIKGPIEELAEMQEFFRAEFSEDPDVRHWEEYASPENAFAT